jgi:hypothetical protein
MNYFRRAFAAGLVIAAGCLLGCGDNTQGMRNVKMGNSDPVEKKLPIKKGDKPMPVEPAGPKAPP